MLRFLFKQKTVYEMRISDWSSDVCSSGLREYIEQGWNAWSPASVRVDSRSFEWPGRTRRPPRARLGHSSACFRSARAAARAYSLDRRCPCAVILRLPEGARRRGARTRGRSEEHTSELQSLMRNSYA